MKANNFKTLDYEKKGDTLQLLLADTSLDEILNMDASTVVIRTDNGDLVEVFAGYTLRSVTYNLDEKTYNVALAVSVPDSTAETLAELAKDIAEAQANAASLSTQLTDTQLALCDVYEQLLAVQKGDDTSG